MAPRLSALFESSAVSRDPSPNGDGQARYGLLGRLRRSRPKSPWQEPSVQDLAGTVDQKDTQVEHDGTLKEAVSVRHIASNGQNKEEDVHTACAPLEVQPILNPTSKCQGDPGILRTLGSKEQCPQTGPAITGCKSSSSPDNACTLLGTNIWAIALDDLEHSHPELISVLRPLLTTRENGHISTRQSASVSDTANEALDKIEAFRDAKMAGHGRSTQFRIYFEATVKLLLSAKNTISSAVAFNPIAASAWTCVSLILPLLLNNTTENEAAMEGLNYITILLVEYRWKEKVYLSADASDDFINVARKVYTSILEYEALLYSHMQDKALIRTARNVWRSGDWHTRLKHLQRLDADCRRVTDTITETRTHHWLEEGRAWQQRLLDQPRQKAEAENLQKLYSNYEYNKDPKNMRVPGTCEWFLKHPDFLTWRDSQTSGLLWLTADPGCGKSVLAKHLVDRRAEVLSAQFDSPTFCYFFFKDGEKDRRDAAKAVCALLYQLFLQKPHLYKYAASDFEKKSDKFLTDLNTLWCIFAAAIKDRELDEVVCVLDGLDECESNSRKVLISLLVELHLSFLTADDTEVSRKVLITSRPYLDIERGFRELTNTIPSIRLSGEKETQSIRSEINLVLDRRIHELVVSHNLSSQVRDALFERLSSIEHRTYLWLRLILGFLENQDEIKARDILRPTGLFASIPASIEEAYDNILNRSNDATRARRLLHYVLAAVSPLTIPEMNILMNIDDECRTKDDLRPELWTEAVMESTVKNICGLFITIIDSRIYLIHQTAVDYLKKTSATIISLPTSSSWKHTFCPQESALAIAKSCISFLSLEDFGDKSLRLGNWKMRNTREYALFTYAARYWPHHLANAGLHTDAKALHNVTAKLFNMKDEQRFNLWIGEYRKAANPYTCFPIGGSTLMWAAYFGQAVVVAELLRAGHNVNAVDSVGRTALSFAAYCGHLEVVEELLQKKADVDTMDVIEQSPLILSIQGQHLAVSKSLLAAKAAVYSSDVFGRNAFSYCTSQMKESLHDYFSKAENPGQGSQHTTGPVTTDEISPKVKQLDVEIRAYLMLRHRNNQWQSAHQYTLVKSSNGLPSGISQFYDALRAGILAMDSGNEAWYDEGRFHMVIAFNHIKPAIVAESPLVLVYAARLFAYTWHYHQQRLARLILQQMAATACTYHESTSPLATVLSKLHSLLSIEHVDIYCIVNLTLQTCIEAWAQLHGPLHLQVVYVRHIQLEIRGWWQGPASISSELQTLSVDTDAAHGSASLQSIQILVAVAQNLLDQQAFAAAQDKASTVRDKVVALPANISDRRYVHLLCKGLCVLAKAQTALGQFDGAEESYRALLKRAEDSWNGLHPRMKEYRRIFGLWLYDRGRSEEAMLYGI